MSGRATTPQAQTRTRAKRSASREVSASPATTRAGGRRGARQASAEAGEEGGHAAAGNTRRTKRGKKDTAAPLPPVEEDPDAIPTDPQLESPSLLSNVSGTTAVSSAGETDSTLDDVCFTLPHLFEATEDLLEVLAPDNATADDLLGIIEDVNLKGTRTNLSLQRCEDSFTTRIESLTDAQYINPTVFLRSVLRPRPVAKLDTSLWRPDDILFKANLGSLARRLVTRERETDETHDILRNLDLIFPSFFACAFGASPDGRVPTGSSSLLRQTFEFALEIRTQFFILYLLESANEPNFNPDEIIDNVFFKPDSNGKLQVKGWDLPQLGDVNPMREEFQQSVQQRVQRVRDHTNKDEVDFVSLQEDFSWQAFQVAALDWIRMRNRELNDAIEDRGGARTITKELRRKFDTSSTPTSSARRTPSSLSAARRRTQSGQAQGQADPLDAATNKRIDSSDLALLKALGKGGPASSYAGISAIPPIQENVAHANTAPAGFESVHQNDAGNWAQGDEEDYAQPTDPALLQEARALPDWTTNVLHAASQQDRLNQENLNRTRSFIDRQNGAERLDFGDGFSQAAQSGTSTQRNLASSALRAGYANGKRRAPYDDDELDPSQDAGFQTDERNIDYAERRMMAPPPGRRHVPVANMTGESPRKRARFSQYDGEDEHNGSTPYEGDEGRGQSTGEQYQRIKEQAREATKVAASRGVLARPTASQGDRGIGRGAGNPGKRKWSQEQEGQLIDYIEEYGCKWAEIKKIDDNTEHNILGQWSQVDLKDKAINIRVDLLKSRTGEPANFEFISLRQRDRDKLAAMGINVPPPVQR